MRPVHEYFTENDMNIYDQRINVSENKIAALNNVYDSTSLLDISKNIIDLSSNLTYLTNLQIATKLNEINTKIDQLGTVQTTSTITLTANTNSKQIPVSYKFTLPVGTWLVIAHIVYISNQGNTSPTITDSQIGVAINPKPYDNITGYNSIRDFQHVEFPRTGGRYTRFSVSATIKVTNPSTEQNVSIYDGDGTVKVTVISTLIGF
jgi:hypothetical protein